MVKNPFKVIRAQLDKAMLVLNQEDSKQHSAISWAASAARRLYPLEGAAQPQGEALYRLVMQLDKDLGDAYDELADPQMFTTAKPIERKRALDYLEKADDVLEEYQRDFDFVELRIEHENMSEELAATK